MKTFTNLYEEYKEYIDKNADITEEEYNEIMQCKVTLTDVMNKLCEYGRFAVFSQKWIENNKEELIEALQEEKVEE